MHRSKKKRRLFLALAAVLILVCGSVMTGTGSKSYWKVLWDRVSGSENLSVVNVEDMDAQEAEDLDEVQLFNEIRKETGISPVRFGYMPKNLFFTGYEMDKEQNRAIIFYKYNGQVIRYSMYMNNSDSSHGQTELDDLIDEYQIDTQNEINVDIKVYIVDDSDENRYAAEFEYMDAQYRIMGVMEKDEFDKIIENLIFLQ